MQGTFFCCFRDRKMAWERLGPLQDRKTQQPSEITQKYIKNTKKNTIFFGIFLGVFFLPRFACGEFSQQPSEIAQNTSKILKNTIFFRYFFGVFLPHFACGEFSYSVGGQVFRKEMARMSHDWVPDVPGSEKLYAKNFGLIFRSLFQQGISDSHSLLCDLWFSLQWQCFHQTSAGEREDSAPLRYPSSAFASRDPIFEKGPHELQSHSGPSVQKFKKSQQRFPQHIF